MSKDKPRLEDNLGLARHYARQYQGMLKEYPSIEYEDLYQECLIALAKACEKFDPTKNVKLEYIAAVWMKQAMSNLLKLKGATVQIPWKRKEKASEGDEVYSSFTSIPMDMPNIDELDLVEDLEDDEEAQLLIQMQDAIEKLRPIDRDILTLYYGLGNHQRLNQREIAEKLNISKNRAGQKIKFAQDKLKKEMEKSDVQKKKEAATKEKIKRHNQAAREYRKRYRELNRERIYAYNAQWNRTNRRKDSEKNILKAIAIEIQKTTRTKSSGFKSIGAAAIRRKKKDNAKDDKL